MRPNVEFVIEKTEQKNRYIARPVNGTVPIAHMDATINKHKWSDNVVICVMPGDMFDLDTFHTGAIYMEGELKSENEENIAIGKALQESLQELIKKIFFIEEIGITETWDC